MREPPPGRDAGFPHWRLLRRADFLCTSSDVYLSVRGAALPGLREVARWRLGPGDVDSLQGLLPSRRADCRGA